jgi:probable F420-dependent oxidoreductase
MPRSFRFGVVAASAPSQTAWIRTARRAEELGYATLLLPDRMMGAVPALFPALAVAASVTTTLRVGSYVCSNEYRHPVLLAREAATLDLLSGGRFELGLGAGVGPADFQQMGLPFPNASTRVGRLEEALQILKQIFTQETLNFSGQHYTITGMKGDLKPVQQPHPPLLVAGAGERMLKLAAREADSIAIGLKISGQGADPTDAPLEQKIAWIKEAAGQRFANLELCQTIYGFQITDSRAELPAQTGGWQIPKTPMLTSQAVTRLLEERERYGFSYLQIAEWQMENFAPVVAQLAGK